MHMPKTLSVKQLMKPDGWSALYTEKRKTGRKRERKDGNENLSGQR